MSKSKSRQRDIHKHMRLCGYKVVKLVTGSYGIKFDNTTITTADTASKAISIIEALLNYHI